MMHAFKTRTGIHAMLDMLVIEVPLTGAPKIRSVRVRVRKRGRKSFHLQTQHATPIWVGMSSERATCVWSYCARATEWTQFGGKRSTHVTYIFHA